MASEDCDGGDSPASPLCPRIVQSSMPASVMVVVAVSGVSGDIKDYDASNEQRHGVGLASLNLSPADRTGSAPGFP
jgi:hypothetical protein